ncbi:MAG: UDP-N-acetylmuramoyl-L-alanyl-D-glutamate--2,6-diaminopimelate ligase [Candidatus Omnitrophota bacterium]|nr:UDP-N-acetylmuramoyl-L-alanyl-D-glutamate--2,6-diaminopimelate ligase [Candidatus Omnitrophota bacterium]
MPRIKNIFNGIKYKSGADYSAINIKAIKDDSRQVKKRDLFIATRGYSTDGYRFIGQAIKNGASVVVSDRDFRAPGDIKKIIVKDARLAVPAIASNFYGHPSGVLKLVGITGTNGKTTITYLMENILKAAKKRSGVIGTINYRINGSQIPATNTTPGALALQSLLYQMLKNKTKYVLMEVSSHSLDQDRVGKVFFDVGVFTNITKEHLDYHKTLKNYLKAKTKLFEKLKRDGVAVLNNDDRMVASLRSGINKKVLTYGINKNSDVTASNISLSMDSSSFTVKTPKGSFNVTTRLIGRHNISNILASVAVSIALGIKPGAIKSGIESFKVVPGRLEPVEEGQQFKVFVDYAHTEDALHNVLSLLKDVTTAGRIITVFGCGGNRDRAKRPLMGSVACKFSDRVVVTSDNPRFEDPMSIISQIEEGIKDKFANYDIVPDRHDAINKALTMARKGDVVLIAGKGHEKCQIVNDKALAFDDCEVTSSILRTIIV